MRKRITKAVIFKTLGTAALALLLALLTRYGLGAEEWKHRVENVSTWGLVGLLILVGILAILVEFAHAFMIELSAQARVGGRVSARIIASLPRALKLVCVRMADSAIDIFMRRSFDSLYRTRVYEDYGIFNDRGLGLINAARLDLEKVYVELRIANQLGKVAPTDMLRRDVPRDAGDRRTRYTIWGFLPNPRKGAAIVIVGAPGSGKTTLLQNLLLTFSANRQRRHNVSRRLPVLVELRVLGEFLSKTEIPDLATAIRACWASSVLSDLTRREPKGWLEHRLRAGRIIFLLDGMDEVPASARTNVSRWIALQVREYRECTFVVTSRPGGYAEAPIKDAVVLEVLPFNMEQTDRFIDSWYLAHEIVASGNRDDAVVRRRATNEANALRMKLKDSPDLDDLTVNPLLLTMVCMVHRFHGALPGSRSQLYGEICQVLLERWRQARELSDELNGEQTLAVLRPLAEQFMTREVRELGEIEIQRLIEGPLAEIGYPATKADSPTICFLRAVQANSGLLLEKEAGRWSFAHKTFQEYLTAEYWLRTSKALPEWSEKVSSDWWRESLLLFAAREEATDLVEAALALESPSSWALAYQCLLEAQRLAPATRSKTEALIKKGLVSPDETVFLPAARAFHHLQQRRVRRISESLEQRAEPVSQVEYQLFLDTLEPAARLGYFPPHWTSDRFSGNPEAPIQGTLLWQAKGFASWAEGGAYVGRWELPVAGHASEAIDAAMPFWCASGELLDAAKNVNSNADDLFPVGIEIALTPTTKQLHEIETALDNVIGIDYGMTRNAALILAHSLQDALTTAFGFDQEDFQGTRQSYHSRSAAKLEYFFRTNWGDRPKLWRVAVQEKVAILVGAKELHERQIAWRDYAYELLRLAGSHLPKKHPMQTMHSALALIEERRTGRANARECIVLVRNRRVAKRRYDS